MADVRAERLDRPASSLACRNGFRPAVDLASSLDTREHSAGVAVLDGALLRLRRDER
jgi:hypothetical protein